MCVLFQRRLVERVRYQRHSLSLKIDDCSVWLCMDVDYIVNE